MNTDRWGRLQELFHAALKQPAFLRPEFLAAACADDPELRCEVESLLAHEGRADELLESSVWETDPTATGNQTPEPLSVGACIAQYRITGKLGSGGMGTVFRATDDRLQREVALKVFPAAFTCDAQWMSRFQYEARVLASLNHPHIAAIHGLEEWGDQRAIAMELVEGSTLAKRMENGPLPETESFAIARQVAEALQYSHAHGIIHCDLKPANIMVDGQGQVKLLDFGIARRFRRAEADFDTPGNDGTMAGAVAGTIGYMSPEQLRGLPVDHRTDFFALGVLAYEMLTGNRPFFGETRIALAEAILHAPPRDFDDSPVAGKTKSLIRKLLEKEPSDRHSSAAEILEELKELEIERTPAHWPKYRWMGICAAVLLVACVAGWLGLARSHERWARETAMPEIAGLLEAGEYVKAAALTQEARAVLPTDPTLAKLWLRATGEVLIASEPAGAEVEARPYSGGRNAWKPVGKTPLEGLRMPRHPYVWRIRKPGFAEVMFIGEPVGLPVPGYSSRFTLPIKLVPLGQVPPDVVPVPAGRTGLAYPLGTARVARVANFLIGRHEVTNREYKRFVDAGGYRERSFWNQALERDGRTVAWEEAVAGFRDATGYPGPSTWVRGDFPKGQENHPVSGVSWYEAEAYSKFVGMQLPTAYHWTLASQSGQFTAVITPGGNFAGDGTQAVGSDTALSGYGTADMAGNVKEWCSNEAPDGRRLILGGGFGEPNYMFHHTDAKSPWDRPANAGFRTAKLDALPDAIAASKIEVTQRDYWMATPVSDDVFKAYSTLYGYDKGETNPHVQQLANNKGWSHEKITIDAAYGQERFAVHLYLPRDVTSPFQTVVYFPGAGSFLQDKLDLSGLEETRGFLVNSGRALAFPIYKGMYERRDGMIPGRNPPAFQRDHQIAWVKDLGRLLDYLETRREIDSSKIGYFGDSLGGVEGAILPAIERRIKAGILSCAGLQLTVRYQPEADPFNFVKHVKIPVLMLNGRYDASFPVESSQRPLFQFLGTAAEDKKHVIYEAGHDNLPRTAVVRESLNWLDKYLGPVRR